MNDIECGRGDNIYREKSNSPKNPSLQKFGMIPCGNGCASLYDLEYSSDWSNTLDRMGSKILLIIILLLLMASAAAAAATAVGLIVLIVSIFPSSPPLLSSWQYLTSSTTSSSSSFPSVVRARLLAGGSEVDAMVAVEGWRWRRFEWMMDDDAMDNTKGRRTDEWSKFYPSFRLSVTFNERACIRLSVFHQSRNR